MSWLYVFNRKTRETELLCPCCEQIIDEKIIYFFYPEPCIHCKTSLVLLSISIYHDYIYVIDIEKAPSIFMAIVNHLATKNPKERTTELIVLITMFSEQRIFNE